MVTPDFDPDRPPPAADLAAWRRWLRDREVYAGRRMPRTVRETAVFRAGAARRLDGPARPPPIRCTTVHRTARTVARDARPTRDQPTRDQQQQAPQRIPNP